MKAEDNKLGVVLVEECRDDYEANLPDYIRFQKPEDYQTVEELKYFKSEENRERFVELHWHKHVS